MEPYKRRPPGDYQPKADRLDPQPLRRHEDVDRGAFSREAEAKLFGRETAQSSAMRSLREDRRCRPESSTGQGAGAIGKAECSSALVEKSLATSADQRVSATWRKQPLEPALREAMAAVAPKQAPSGCASVLFVVLAAILLLLMALGFITGAR